MRTLALFKEKICANPTSIIETIHHHCEHPTEEGFRVIETTSGVADKLGL
jgi:hypothetical protein